MALLATPSLELGGAELVGLEPAVVVRVMVLPLSLLDPGIAGVVTVLLPPVRVVMVLPPVGGGESVVTELLWLLVVPVVEELWEPVEEVPVALLLLLLPLVEEEPLPPVLVEEVEEPLPLLVEVGAVLEPVLVGWPVWVAEGVHWSAGKVKGFSA